MTRAIVVTATRQVDYYAGAKQALYVDGERVWVGYCGDALEGIALAIFGRFGNSVPHVLIEHDPFPETTDPAWTEPKVLPTGVHPQGRAR